MTMNIKSRQRSSNSCSINPRLAQILIRGKNRKSLLVYWFCPPSWYRARKQKAISFSIDLYVYTSKRRETRRKRKSFYVLHVYWLELKSENELYIFTVHTHKRFANESRLENLFSELKVYRKRGDKTFGMVTYCENCFMYIWCELNLRKC